jgi:DNA-binding NarL/FixJ family response regulator
MPRLRIAVVDDHPIFREGVAQALGSAEDLEIVAEGSSADEAIEIAQNHLPDVLLLDINMPGCGIDAVRAITRQCPRVKVMMLTVSSADDDVDMAIDAGAHAYVLKGISGPDFIHSVRTLHEGEHFLRPDIAARLLAKAKRSSIASAELPTLSQKEEEILRYLANGMNKAEVAREIGMEENLVSDFIGNILQKLHIRAILESALSSRH